jgi:carboxylesterase type B
MGVTCITWVEFIVCVCVLCALLHGCVAPVIVKQMGPSVIHTNYGNIRGALVEFPVSASGQLRPVECFLGLQYAAVLKGQLRFMPPTSPQEKWKGMRVALNHRPVCPQRLLDEKELSKRFPNGRVQHLKRIKPFLTSQAEDCLTLNLYVPKKGK